MCLMLKTLRSSFVLCLLTNGHSKVQWEKVKRIEVEDYFDHVVVSGDHPWNKPDAKLFDLVSSLSDTSLNQALMIADSLETDIQGGVDAGVLATVWISEACDNDLSNFRISNVLELPKLLKEKCCD
jgi:N-acylneuraminate-9-phosphatase